MHMLGDGIIFQRMWSITRTRGVRARLYGPLLVCLVVSVPCLAEPVWFDATNRAAGYATFRDLATGYDAFVSGTSDLITFSDLADGETLGDQYTTTHGVSFENTTSGRRRDRSGIHAEGGRRVRNLTGYDGSHRPDGDLVFRKTGNDVNATPFTILFDDPVASVGAFVGMGTQGRDHSLSISLYDSNGRLLDTRTVDSSLWETRRRWQNYESFFAVRADEAIISRVEILNNSTRRSADALILDDLTFGSQIIPEPVTGMLLLAGAWLFFVRRHSMRRRPHAMLRSPATTIH